MFIQLCTVARRRWVPAVAVIAGSVGLAALAGAVPAAASPLNLVNCSANHQALQPAIDAASQGEILLVTGTCTGPFTISSDLTLSGIGPAVLDGNQAGRTVAVGTGARVHLDHLSITNGVGGINNEGTLTVSDSTVSGNTASSGPGGGINNEAGATLVVSRSTVRHNDSLGAGGAINNNGTMTVSFSDLFGNSADNCGAIDSDGTAITATVTDTAVHGNTARVSDGGGICNSPGSTMTISGSAVSGNTAAFGAGLYDNQGTTTVIGSMVFRNTASDQGGGVYDVNGGTMTLTHTAVEGNAASGGSGSGGGIFLASGTVTLRQSQVRDNKPDNCGGSDSVEGCTG